MRPDRTQFSKESPEITINGHYTSQECLCADSIGFRGFPRKPSIFSCCVLFCRFLCNFFCRFVAIYVGYAVVFTLRLQSEDICLLLLPNVIPSQQFFVWLMENDVVMLTVSNPFSPPLCFRPYSHLTSPQVWTLSLRLLLLQLSQASSLL